LKDSLSGLAVGVGGGVLRYQAGDPNWLIAFGVAGVSVAAAVLLPQAETVFWLVRRNTILLDERDARIAELESARPVSGWSQSSMVAAPLEKPHAAIEFICDGPLGWPRLRVTNSGAGALFSATIQLYGTTAAAVQYRRIPAKWEMGDTAQQRIAHGETRSLWLASVGQIAPGVRGWLVHRSDGDDIKGVELTEMLDVTLTADPDLDEPCHLQLLLQADGGSQMARAGVEPLVHVVPPRVAHMRRLLVEAAEYVRQMPTRTGHTKDAIDMSIAVKIVVPELLLRAFGIRAPAVYLRHLKEAGERGAQNACVAFSLITRKG
jgi:hypothetical protein